MAKMLTSTRSLLLAGALAFAALPALAQTAPQAQPAAPAAGAATTTTSGAATSKTDLGTTGKTATTKTDIGTTGKTATSKTDSGTTGKTVTSKPAVHGKTVASAHKSNVHRVSTKKHATTSMTPKPASNSSTGTGATQLQ